VEQMRAGCGRPRPLDLQELQRIAGIAAADCALRLGRSIPSMLEPVAAERDQLRAELDAVARSKAWRTIERAREVRRRLLPPRKA